MAEIEIPRVSSTAEPHPGRRWQEGRAGRVRQCPRLKGQGSLPANGQCVHRSTITVTEVGVCLPQFLPKPQRRLAAGY